MKPIQANKWYIKNSSEISLALLLWLHVESFNLLRSSLLRETGYESRQKIKDECSGAAVCAV